MRHLKWSREEFFGPSGRVPSCFIVNKSSNAEGELYSKCISFCHLNEIWDLPSAWDFTTASAYTRTTSSVPLGRTKDRPPSYLRTNSSIFVCSPGGLTNRRSASSVLKAFRSPTTTLTRRFGRSAYNEFHSTPEYDLWASTTSTSNMSENASPTVWLIRCVRLIKWFRAVDCAGVEGSWPISLSWVDLENRTVP